MTTQYAATAGDDVTAVRKYTIVESALLVAALTNVSSGVPYVVSFRDEGPPIGGTTIFLT
jgi:hypothetical protein